MTSNGRFSKPCVVVVAHRMVTTDLDIAASAAIHLPHVVASHQTSTLDPRPFLVNLCPLLEDSSTRLNACQQILRLNLTISSKLTNLKQSQPFLLVIIYIGSPWYRGCKIGQLSGVPLD